MLKKFCALLLGLFACTANAAAQPAAAQTPPAHIWRPIVALSGGYAFINTNTHTAQFIAYDDAQFTLRDNSATSSHGLMGAFAGVEWELNNPWLLQTGFGYYQPSTLNIYGNESQGVIGSLPTYDFYQYEYAVTIKQFLAEAKVLYTWRTYYHPFVAAGMGATFNKARSYSINFPVFLTFAPKFANRSSISFSYRLGFGLDYDIGTGLRLGIDYYFTDLGKAQLANGTVDSSYQTLTKIEQPHLFANELVGQLTMVF